MSTGAVEERALAERCEEMAATLRERGFEELAKGLEAAAEYERGADR